MPELPTSSLRRLPPAIQPIKTVFTYQSLWACHSVFESDAQRGGKEWPSYTPQSCELPLPDDLSFISLSEIGSKQSVFLQAIQEVGTRWLGINGSSLKQRLRCLQERNRAYVAYGTGLRTSHRFHMSVMLVILEPIGLLPHGKKKQLRKTCPETKEHRGRPDWEH